MKVSRFCTPLITWIVLTPFQSSFSAHLGVKGGITSTDQSASYDASTPVGPNCVAQGLSSALMALELAARLTNPITKRRLADLICLVVFK
jgi:hypothetical protein